MPYLSYGCFYQYYFYELDSANRSSNIYRSRAHGKGLRPRARKHLNWMFCYTMAGYIWILWYCIWHDISVQSWACENRTVCIAFP